MKIQELNVGDKVRFQLNHSLEYTNGIVKEIPDFPVGSHLCDCVRVVYSCDLERYKYFPSELTDVKDLKKGWRND